MKTMEDMEKTVEEVFESKNLLEVKNYSRALERSVDQKREELRTMVGESYRDLMEAADTMMKMKSTAESFSGSLAAILESASKSHIAGGGGGRNDNDDDLPCERTAGKNNVAARVRMIAAAGSPSAPRVGGYSEGSPEAAMASLAGQIKLLVDSPEMMWAAVDESDYLRAAQIFLFVRHVHSNLTLEAAPTSSAAGGTLSAISSPSSWLASNINRFPVIERQWASVQPFHDLILDNCRAHLLVSGTDLDEASHCETNDGDHWMEKTRQGLTRSLAAILLLKGCSVAEVFKEYLDLRSKAVKAAAAETSSSSSSTPSGADWKSAVKSSSAVVSRNYLKSVVAAVVRSLFGCLTVFGPSSSENKCGLEAELVSLRKVKALEALFHGSWSSPTLMPVMAYLPTIVSEFRCRDSRRRRNTAQGPLMIVQPLTRTARPENDDEEENLLDQEVLKNSVTSWLDGIHGDVAGGARRALAHVASIRGLAALQRSVLKLLKGPKSEEDVQEDVQEDDRSSLFIAAEMAHVLRTFPRIFALSLWDEFFRNPFQERVEQLVEEAVDRSFDGALLRLLPFKVKGEAEVLLQQGEKTREPTTPFFASYLWSESFTETTTEASSSSASGPVPALASKVKGYYAPEVIEFCQELDSGLTTLSQDILAYVGDADHHHQPQDGVRSTSTKLQTLLLEFLEKTVRSKMANFLGKELAVEEIPGGVDSLTTCRVTLALQDLCPALRRCVTARASMAGDGGGGSSSKTKQLYNYLDFDPIGPLIASSTAMQEEKEWEAVKTVLKDRSREAFDSWLTRLVGKHSGRWLELDDSCQRIPPLSASLLSVEWESVEISEEAEDGRTVQSVIRVPQALSRPLHDFLWALARDLALASPLASGSPEFHDILGTRVVASILASYFRGHFDGVRRLTQNVALQLHFDLQFVAQFMVPERTAAATLKGQQLGLNREIPDLLQEMSTAVESHIDPFDLSVFGPHLANSLKRYILRNQATFGFFLPKDRSRSLAAAAKRSQAQQQGTAASDLNQSSICLSGLVDRFQLLPIRVSATSISDTASSKILITAVTTTSVASDLNFLSAADVRASTRSSSGQVAKNKDRKRDRSPVTRATGGFFEAMSSSFFGGKL